MHESWLKNHVGSLSAFMDHKHKTPCDTVTKRTWSRPTWFGKRRKGGRPSSLLYLHLATQTSALETRPRTMSRDTAR